MQMKQQLFSALLGRLRGLGLLRPTQLENSKNEESDVQRSYTDLLRTILAFLP